MLRHACLTIALCACGSAQHGGGDRVAADATPTVLGADDLARDAALAPRAAAYVDAFTNSAAWLLRDGRMVYMSTRGGLPALYVADAARPDAAPTKLPGPDEWIGGLHVLPGERAALFVSDHSSDGNYHVFRVELDGSGFTDLTPEGELHRDTPAVADRGEVFAYSAHTIADATAHVFVQRPDGAPREIYVDQGSGYVIAMSPDGGRALYARVVADESQILFAIDVATGKATRVYPPDGEIAAIGDAAFTADGSGLYVASEHAGRAAQVLLLDAATGAERARWQDATAPHAGIAQIAPSPAGDRVAIVLDAGDHAELRMTDAALAHGRAVAIGLGSARAGAWSADGARLTLSMTRPDAPGDVFVLDPATDRISALRADPRPGLADVHLTATIEHVAAFDGGSIPVNVFLPPAAAHGRLPTIVLVHGGPSGSSAIAWGWQIGFWTAMGFAVIAPNIRGSTGFGIEYMAADDRDKRGDALRDMESVNRWARAQPWCDGDRIVIDGISYGGYMTLLAVGKQPELWRAGIDGSGMSNLVTMEQLEDQSIRVFDETEFGTIGKDDAVLKAWSPLTWVDHVIAPVFVYQGVHDPITPQDEADQIVRALRSRRIPVEYMLVENEGHGVSRRENKIAYLVRSYRFVADQLQIKARSAPGT